MPEYLCRNVSRQKLSCVYIFVSSLSKKGVFWLARYRESVSRARGDAYLLGLTMFKPYAYLFIASTHRDN